MWQDIDIFNIEGDNIVRIRLYYDLKEKALRQIEWIEEKFLRKLLRTSKGCPITSLYLEMGEAPARYAIIKIRLFYLKYILEQPETSNISKMLNLQLKMPSSGDWATTCIQNLEFLGIELTFEEIRNIEK